MGLPSRVAGALGWAPSHSSACGSSVGSVPRSSGMKVFEPQAYGCTTPSIRKITAEA